MGRLIIGGGARSRREIAAPETLSHGCSWHRERPVLARRPLLARQLKRAFVVRGGGAAVNPQSIGGA